MWEPPIFEAKSECLKSSRFHIGYNTQATSCICSCPVLRLPTYIQNQLKNILKKPNAVHVGCKVVYKVDRWVLMVMLFD